MAKLTLADIASGHGQIDTINANNALLETALNDEVAFRDIPDGETAPMQDDLDMNAQRILNLPTPTNDAEAATKAYVDAQTNTGTGTVSTLTESQDATAGQTVFTLNSLTYTPGANNLDIYINGVHQNLDAYSETSTTSVTFSVGLEAGDSVFFKANQRSVASDTVAAASITYSPGGGIASDVQTRLDLTQKTFTTVANMVADTGLNVGDWVVCEDYATGYFSGPLFFKVVAAATGTADGGEYIDLNLHQAQQNFPAVVTVDMWGASEANADNAAAINAAVAFVQSTQASRVKNLQLTNQTYTIKSTINFKDHSGAYVRFPFTMSGLGSNREGSASTIKADASFTDANMFTFADTAGSGTNSYYNFSDFTLDGTNLSLNGIVEEVSGGSWNIERMSFINIQGVAVLTSKFDSLNLLRCTFVGNDICYQTSTTTGGTNVLNIKDCEFSSNDEWAIIHTGSTGGSVEGCTIQSNDIGGIHLSGARGFRITGNHFEENGTIGATMTPDGTVKADIVLNGTSSRTTLTNTNPCNKVTIENNSFSTGAAVKHIYANAVREIRVENNIANLDEFFYHYGDTEFSLLSDLIMRNNGEDVPDPAALDTRGALRETQLINIVDTFAADNYNNPDGLHTVDFGIPGINYYPQSFLEYSQLVADGGMNISRAATGLSNQHNAFRLANNGSTSDVFGVTLDIDDNWAFRGKWIWFGVFAQLSTVTDNNIGLYVEFSTSNGPQHNTATVTGTTALRQFVSMAALVPATATTISCGFRKLGTGSGVVDCSHPMLMQVGAPYSSSSVQLPATVGMLSDHVSSSIPTAGQWRQGDFVRKSDPSYVTDASGDYVLTGWLRLTTNSNNVLNTDWVESRSLVGAQKKSVQLTVFEPGVNTATGDGKDYFHVPSDMNGMNLTGVHALNDTAGAASSLTTVQIHNLTDGSDMLSTEITIDLTETGSDTAATPAVIDTGEDDVVTNDVIRIDVDTVAGTPAKGLFVTLEFETP